MSRSLSVLGSGLFASVVAVGAGLLVGGTLAWGLLPADRAGEVQQVSPIVLSPAPSTDAPPALEQPADPAPSAPTPEPAPAPAPAPAPVAPPEPLPVAPPPPVVVDDDDDFDDDDDDDDDIGDDDDDDD